MNKSQLKIPLTILCLLFPFIALVICFKLSPKNTSPELITNIDTAALFKIFDRKPYYPRVEARGVEYSTQPDKSYGKTGIVGRVVVGVFPTVQAAHNNFDNPAVRAIFETKIPDAKIGNEFKCWYGPVGDGDSKGGNFLLRRDNCVLEFSYRGTLQAMVALARKVDAGLQTPVIAQRGDLNVPLFSKSWPQQVRTGSRFKVEFSSSSSNGKTIPILVNTSQPIRESQFSLYERAPQSAGKFTKQFVMATLGNVILSEEIQLEALTTKQAEAARLPKSDEE